MKKEDYPALFISSDSASSSGQRAYINMMVAILVTFGLLGIITSLPIEDTITKDFLAKFAFFLTVLSTFLSLIAKETRKEEIWFDGRVVAESVKSAAWKYMMHSKPFDKLDGDQQFIKRIKEIGDMYVDRDIMPSGELITRPVITNEMKRIRQLPTKERLDIYLEERLSDQMKWYSNNSKRNGNLATFWNNAIISLNIIMIILGIFTLSNSGLTYATVGIFSAASASILSWTQTKKFSELKISYQIAANDLYNATVRASEVTSDEELAHFVSDSENAISREHTAWLSRKARV